MDGGEPMVAVVKGRPDGRIAVALLDRRGQRAEPSLFYDQTSPAMALPPQYMSNVGTATEPMLRRSFSPDYEARYFNSYPTAIYSGNSSPRQVSPQRTEPPKVQSTTLEGGGSSSETPVKIPSMPQSFLDRGMGTGQACYRVSRGTEAFVTTLRRYPSSSPSPVRSSSAELIQKLISYAQNKHLLSNHHTRSMRVIRDKNPREQLPKMRSSVQRSDSMEVTRDTNSNEHADGLKSSVIRSCADIKDDKSLTCEDAPSDMYDYFKPQPGPRLPHGPRTTEVRCLEEVGRCFRDSIMQLTPKECSKCECTKMINRYAKHREQYHGDLGRALPSSPPYPAGEVVVRQALFKRRLSSANKNGPHFNDVQVSESNFIPGPTYNPPWAVGPRGYPMAKICCRCRKPTPCKCVKGPGQAPARKSTHMDYRKISAIHEGIPKDDDSFKARLDHHASGGSNLEDVDIDTKGNITTIVSVWLQEIPVNVTLAPEDKIKRQHLSRNLVTYIISVIGDDDFEDKARVEIEKCVANLPMWYPDNKVDKEEFESEIVENLIIKLRDLQSKEKFMPEIIEWVQIVPFLGHDDCPPNRNEIARLIYIRLRPIIEHRPENDEDFKNLLKREIIDILDEYPLDVQGSLYHFTNRSAESLAYTLMLNSPASKEPPFDPELTRDVYECIQHIPEFSKDNLEETAENLAKIINKRHLKQIDDKGLLHDLLINVIDTELLNKKKDISSKTKNTLARKLVNKLVLSSGHGSRDSRLSDRVRGSKISESGFYPAHERRDSKISETGFLPTFDVGMAQERKFPLSAVTSKDTQQKRLSSTAFKEIAEEQYGGPSNYNKKIADTNPIPVMVTRKEEIEKNAKSTDDKLVDKTRIERKVVSNKRKTGEEDESYGSVSARSDSIEFRKGDDILPNSRLTQLYKYVRDNMADSDEEQQRFIAKLLAIVQDLEGQDLSTDSLEEQVRYRINDWLERRNKKNRLIFDSGSQKGFTDKLVETIKTMSQSRQNKTMKRRLVDEISSWLNDKKLASIKKDENQQLIENLAYKLQELKAQNNDARNVQRETLHEFLEWLEDMTEKKGDVFNRKFEERLVTDLIEKVLEELRIHDEQQEERAFALRQQTYTAKTKAKILLKERDEPEETLTIKEVVTVEAVDKGVLTITEKTEPVVTKTILSSSEKPSSNTTEKEDASILFDNGLYEQIWTWYKTIPEMLRNNEVGDKTILKDLTCKVQKIEARYTDPDILRDVLKEELSDWIQEVSDQRKLNLDEDYQNLLVDRLLNNITTNQADSKKSDKEEDKGKSEDKPTKPHSMNETDIQHAITDCVTKCIDKYIKETGLEIGAEERAELTNDLIQKIKAKSKEEKVVSRNLPLKTILDDSIREEVHNIISRVCPDVTDRSTVEFNLSNFIADQIMRGYSEDEAKQNIYSILETSNLQDGKKEEVSNRIISRAKDISTGFKTSVHASKEMFATSVTASKEDNDKITVIEIHESTKEDNKRDVDTKIKDNPPIALKDTPPEEISHTPPDEIRYDPPDDTRHSLQNDVGHSLTVGKIHSLPNNKSYNPPNETGDIQLNETKEQYFVNEEIVTSTPKKKNYNAISHASALPEKVSLTNISVIKVIEPKLTVADGNIYREFDFYTKLQNVIIHWIDTLPPNCDGLKENSFKETMARDLAYDIIDRHKYLQLNPCAHSGSDEEELEYMRYQIFRWLNKMSADPGDIAAVLPRVDGLMNDIKNVRIPELAKHVGMRIETKLTQGKIPNNLDALQDEISIWINEDIPTTYLVAQDTMSRIEGIKHLANAITNKVKSPESDRNVNKEIREYLPEIIKKGPNFDKIADSLKLRLANKGFIGENTWYLKEDSDEFISENLVGAIFDWLIKRFDGPNTLKRRLSKNLATNAISVFEQGVPGQNIDGTFIDEITKVFKKHVKNQSDSYYTKTSEDLLTYLRTLNMFQDASIRPLPLDSTIQTSLTKLANLSAYYDASPEEYQKLQKLKDNLILQLRKLQDEVGKLDRKDLDKVDTELNELIDILTKNKSSAVDKAEVLLQLLQSLFSDAPKVQKLSSPKAQSNAPQSVIYTSKPDPREPSKAGVASQSPVIISAGSTAGTSLNVAGSQGQASTKIDSKRISDSATTKTLGGATPKTPTLKKSEDQEVHSPMRRRTDPSTIKSTPQAVSVVQDSRPSKIMALQSEATVNITQEYIEEAQEISHASGHSSSYNSAQKNYTDLSFSRNVQRSLQQEDQETYRSISSKYTTPPPKYIPSNEQRSSPKPQDTPDDINKSMKWRSLESSIDSTNVSKTPTQKFTSSVKSPTKTQSETKEIPPAAAQAIPTTSTAAPQDELKNLVKKCVNYWSSKLPFQRDTSKDVVRVLEEFIDMLTSTLIQKGLAVGLKADIFKTLKQLPLQKSRSNPDDLNEYAKQLVELFQAYVMDLPFQIPCTENPDNQNLKTVQAVETLMQKSSMKSSNVSPDNLFQYIQDWCLNLPVYGSTSDENNRIRTLKQSLAYDLISKVNELNQNPELFSDDFIYENLLRDEIDQLLNAVNHPEFGNISQELKDNLVEAIKSGNHKARNELARKIYRTQLRQSISDPLDHLVNTTAEEKAYIDALKDSLVDAFISLRFTEEDDSAKEKFRAKALDELDAFALEYFNRRTSDSSIDSLNINENLYFKLLKIPVPRDETIKSELELIRTKQEINNWAKDQLLKDDTLPDKIHKNKILSILAKRVRDIEHEHELHPEIDIDNVMTKELKKWLQKLPPKQNEVLDIDKMMADLMEKLRKSKSAREYVADQTKSRAGDTTQSSIPPSNLSKNDRDHLEEIRDRNKKEDSKSPLHVSDKFPPVDVGSQTQIPASSAKQSATASPAKETATVSPAKETASTSPAKQSAAPSPAKEFSIASPAKSSTPASPAKPSAAASPSKQQSSLHKTTILSEPVGNNTVLSPNVIVREYKWDSTDCSKLLETEYAIPIQTSTPRSSMSRQSHVPGCQIGQRPCPSAPPLCQSLPPPCMPIPRPFQPPKSPCQPMPVPCYTRPAPCQPMPSPCTEKCLRSVDYRQKLHNTKGNDTPSLQFSKENDTLSLHNTKGNDTPSISDSKKPDSETSTFPIVPPTSSVTETPPVPSLSPAPYIHISSNKHRSPSPASGETQADKPASSTLPRRTEDVAYERTERPSWQPLKPCPSRIANDYSHSVNKYSDVMEKRNGLQSESSYKRYQRSTMRLPSVRIPNDDDDYSSGEEYWDNYCRRPYDNHMKKKIVKEKQCYCRRCMSQKATRKNRCQRNRNNASSCCSSYSNCCVRQCPHPSYMYFRD